MDGGLIERARAGDADAFDELARSRIDSMYRTAVGILGSPADARDATQEALISMWRGLPRLRDARAFEGWLYRVTVNAARMVGRRRRGVREIELQPDAAVTNPEGLEERTFDRAFERLTVDQRALLLRHHLEREPLTDIAVLLGIPEGTVKSRLYAARAALQRALEAERQ
jgi:RNA polymerase sigma-70 factor, ECF subfamily